ncbi:unnamed protein product [Ectocarpus sp. 6 AP-2014]
MIGATTFRTVLSRGSCRATCCEEGEARCEDWPCDDVSTNLEGPCDDDDDGERRRLSSSSSTSLGECSDDTCCQLIDYTCDSFVDAESGASLCPSGYVAISFGESVSCGIGVECDVTTCCEGEARCEDWPCDDVSTNLEGPCDDDDDGERRRLSSSSSTSLGECSDDTCCQLIDYTCDSFVDTESGASLCPSGYRAIANSESISCGVGVACDEATCCEEDVDEERCEDWACDDVSTNLGGPCYIYAYSDDDDDGEGRRLSSSSSMAECSDDTCCQPINYTCDSFVDTASGASLCPSGSSAIANAGNVSCGVGEECDEATCCDEDVELMCDSFVDAASGASLCPSGSSAIADAGSVSCGVGEECDEATCCDEDVELMCDSFVDTASGASLCPSGSSAIANAGNVSCGVGEECDEATCCDEDVELMCDSFVDTASGASLCPSGSSAIANAGNVSCGVGEECDEATCCDEDVELMCDSFVDAVNGASLCPSGFSAIANAGSVSCGVGEECDEATCCDEDTPRPSPAPTPAPFVAPTPGPIFTEPPLTPAPTRDTRRRSPAPSPAPFAAPTPRPMSTQAPLTPAPTPDTRRRSPAPSPAPFAAPTPRPMSTQAPLTPAPTPDTRRRSPAPTPAPFVAPTPGPMSTQAPLTPAPTPDTRRRSPAPSPAPFVAPTPRPMSTQAPLTPAPTPDVVPLPTPSPSPPQTLSPVPEPTMPPTLSQTAPPIPFQTPLPISEETLQPSPGETVSPVFDRTLPPTPESTVPPTFSQTAPPEAFQTLSPNSEETLQPSPGETMSPTVSPVFDRTLPPAPESTVPPTLSQTAPPEAFQTLSPNSEETLQPSPGETMSPVPPPVPESTVPPTLSQSTPPVAFLTLSPTSEETLQPSPGETMSPIDRALPPVPESTVPPTLSQTTPPAAFQTLSPTSEETLPPSPGETMSPVFDRTLPPVPESSVPPTLLQTTPPVVFQTLSPNSEETFPPSPGETMSPVFDRTLPPVPESSVPPTLSQTTPPIPSPSLAPMSEETLPPSRGETMSPVFDRTLPPVPEPPVPVQTPVPQSAVDTLSPSVQTPSPAEEGLVWLSWCRFPLAVGFLPAKPRDSHVTRVRPSEWSLVCFSCRGSLMCCFVPTLYFVPFAADYRWSSVVFWCAIFAVAGAVAVTVAPGATASPGATVSPITTIAPGTTLAPGETWAPALTVRTPSPGATSAPGATASPGATVAPITTIAPGTTLAPGETWAPALTVRTASPGATSAPGATASPGATVAPIITIAPGTTLSPGETWAPALTIRTAPPGATSAPGATASPGATPAPSGGAGEVESPGTTAAGAVSIVALIGIMVVSTGSIVRSNHGNGSVSSAGGAVGASADGSRGLVGTAGAIAPVGETGEGDTPSRVSHRRPSATLAFVLMTQLQFLAMLSLVDYVVSQGSWLADFVVGLRWINLWWPAEIGEDIASDGCIFETGASEIGALVFVGNLALVLGILLAIFFLHVAVVSGAEALWLTKKRARENLDGARRRNTPISELLARFRGGRMIRRTNPGLTDPSPFGSRNPSLVRDGSQRTDEEEGGRGLVPMCSENQLSPVATCREHSTSAWLHFPHVELVFLFFAFEGAVASFASAIRNSECPEVFYTAIAAMVLYPLLMFATVVRTLFVRVRPDELLIFKTYDEDGTNGNAPNCRGGFLSRFKSSWAENYSLFSWADKGQWETVQAPNRNITREGDWFRIGFEPVFVDYTKRGTWFIVISLVEWASIALVGVMIDNSNVQLLLFCGLQSAMFLMLVCLKPFANSVINGIGACIVAIDAACTGLLAVAALKWEGTSRATDVNSAVGVLQIVSLCALVIPVYLDAVTIVMGAIRNRIRKALGKTGQQQLKGESPEARDYIRTFTRRQWCGTWCAMLRHNVFACARDTREGVRKPHLLTAARSGPYPPLDKSIGPDGTEGDGGPPRRPSFNAIGTVHTPVVVSGSRATAWGGIPRQSSLQHGDDRAATASLNGMSAVPGAASGKVVIQQGVDSSARDAEPPAPPSAVFTSTGRDAAASLNSMSVVEGISSGKEIIQQGVDSSGRDTELPARPSAVFTSTGRDATTSLNGMSVVEGVSSGKEIIQQGVDSSGHYAEPFATQSAVFASTDHDAAISMNSMSVVGGISSGRDVIHQGVDSSGRGRDSRVAPCASHSSDFIPTDVDEDKKQRISVKASSVFGSSGGGTCTVQAGASGRGLMTGDGLGGPDHSRGASATTPCRHDVGPTNISSAKERVLSFQNTLFVSSSDIASESSSAAKGSSRSIIRRGESNEHENYTPSPKETGATGVGSDQISGAGPVGGGRKGEPKLAFLRSRPPVEKDVPRRRGVAGLALAAATPTVPSATVPESESTTIDDEKLDGDGGADESMGSNGRGNPKGLFQFPRGTRGSTEIDVSEDILPAICDSPAASEFLSVDSDKQQTRAGHHHGGSRRKFGGAFPRLSLTSRNNPTESSFPRRRSADAWNHTVDESMNSLRASIQEEEDGGASGIGAGNGGGKSDMNTEEEDDLPRVDVTTSEENSNRGESGKGGSGLWGLKNKAPVAYDLPRRSSGYSADSSGRADGSRGQFLPWREETGDVWVGNDPDSTGATACEGRERSISGARSTSVFAGLMGQVRRPLESDRPRRRGSMETSLVRGRAVLPGEDVSKSSGASAEDVDSSSGFAVSASRRAGGSNNVSRDLAWPAGSKGKNPVVSDLPRRTSGYSADTSAHSVGELDVSGGRAFQEEEHPADRIAFGIRSDTKPGVDSARQDSRGNPVASGGRKSLFPTLVGYKHAPVESDLPRRRASEYSGAAEPNEDPRVDGAMGGGADTDEAAADLSIGTSDVDGSRGQRRDGARWGLGRRAPIASDHPRRSSVRSSGPAHAVAVLASQGSSRHDDAGLPESFVFAEDYTSVRLGDGLGVSVGSSMLESGESSSFVRGWSGRTQSARSMHSPRHGDVEPEVNTDGLSFTRGPTAVRSGHGLGISIGSSIGEIDGYDHDLGDLKDQA